MDKADICSLLMLGAIISIGKIIKSNAEVAIASNAACPITYDEMKFEWFLPKVILTKPVINGRCYSNPSSSLKLADLAISFQSPSFWPLGVKLHTKIKHKLSVINIYPTVGLGGQVIKIEKSSIEFYLYLTCNHVSLGEFNISPANQITSVLIFLYLEKLIAV